VIWTSGITRAGFIPEVFDCKEVVSWCAKKYIPRQRIIPLCDHSPVSLSAQVFRKMLKLSEPTLTFRGQDCKQFLEKHDNELDILADFLEDQTTVPEDITKLQVSSFRNPFSGNCLVVYNNNGTGIHDKNFPYNYLYFVLHSQGTIHFRLGEANFY
jgi:hypothetical protein